MKTVDRTSFRHDAIAHRYQRSDGPPLQLGRSPWRWSSLLLAACALGVILFLWLGEYTRKARAMGQLVPVAGLLRVHAPQAGTLASPQQVQTGQVLLRLYSDRAVAGGEVQQQVLRQLDARSQSRQTLAALYATRRAEASHKVAQLQSQLDGLARQTALAQSRSALAGKALQRQQQLVAEGFVSAASLEDKQAELMQADGQVAARQAAQAEVARLLTSAQAEAQQLPLARALYRQPDILFMDEASSHLDLALEQRINEQLRQLPITRIAVAHRPQTLQMADRIIDLGTPQPADLTQNPLPA